MEKFPESQEEEVIEKKPPRGSSLKKFARKAALTGALLGGVLGSTSDAIAGEDAAGVKDKPVAAKVESGERAEAIKEKAEEVIATFARVSKEMAEVTSRGPGEIKDFMTGASRDLRDVCDPRKVYIPHQLISEETINQIIDAHKDLTEQFFVLKKKATKETINPYNWFIGALDGAVEPWKDARIQQGEMRALEEAHAAYKGLSEEEKAPEEIDEELDGKITESSQWANELVAAAKKDIRRIRTKRDAMAFDNKFCRAFKMEFKFPTKGKNLRKEFGRNARDYTDADLKNILNMKKELEKIIWDMEGKFEYQEVHPSRSSILSFSYIVKDCERMLSYEWQERQRQLREDFKK